MEEIITDGFVSAGEPILVTDIPDVSAKESPWKAEHPDGTIEAFSLGFVKGAARVTTLHAILVVALQDKTDLMKECRGWGGMGLGQECTQVCTVHSDNNRIHPDQRPAWGSHPNDKCSTQDRCPRGGPTQATIRFNPGQKPTGDPTRRPPRPEAR